MNYDVVRRKIVRGEKVWHIRYDENNSVKYIITSKQDRSMYYLYSVNGDNISKIQKSKSPADLERKLE